MVTCLNCNQTFDGKFCNVCGQKASVSRITFSKVVHDLPHQLFHIDRGILINVKAVLHPQKSVHDFISGKRVRYFNPFLFFFITTGLILYLDHIMGRELNYAFDLEVEGKLVDGGKYINDNIKYIYFLCAIPFALPNKWFFGKQTGYNYAENIVATTFLAGFVNIAYLPVIWLPKDFSFPQDPKLIVLYYMFTILVFWNREKPWLTFIKAAFVVCTQYFLFFILIIFLSLIEVFLTTGSLLN